MKEEFRLDLQRKSAGEFEKARGVEAPEPELIVEETSLDVEELYRAALRLLSSPLPNLEQSCQTDDDQEQ